MSPDIVIPVRAGARNEELRYCLRSLVNVPHGRVHIFGKPPRWVNRETARVVEMSSVGSKYDTVEAHLMQAVLDPAVSDPFVLFNDDFYVTAPIDSVPVLNRGTVAEVIEEHIGNAAVGSYPASMAQSVRAMGWDQDDAMSYELHVPMTMHKSVLHAALVSRPKDQVRRWNVRTVYGNLLGDVGERIADVKVYNQGDPIREPFSSSADHTFRFMRDELFAMFPEPSWYELP